MYIIDTLGRRMQIACVVLLLPLLLGGGSASAHVCPNEPIRARLHSAALPDCRAYELVSSGSKFGWPLSVSRVSSSGDRVVALSLGAFQGAEQQALFDFYEFARGADGWGTSPLNTPPGYDLGVEESAPIGMSPDLTDGLFGYRLPGAVDPRETGLYVRGLPNGSPLKVGPRVLHSRLASTLEEVTLHSSAGASRDLSRVLFMLSGPAFVRSEFVDYLWPGDETAPTPLRLGSGRDSLYEYIGTGNSAPISVGVDSGHMIGTCGTSLGYPSGGGFTSLRGDDLFNAISAPSGSRAFFTVAAGPCETGGRGPAANELWASEEVSPGIRRSVAISEPETGSEGDCSDCNTESPQAAVFQGASEDGSKVFFLTAQHLLDGAEGLNLYEFDFNAPMGRRVTLLAPNMLGVARVAEDGSHVYLVSKDILTGTSNSVGDVAHVDADNLYVYDTTTGGVSFVGDLSAGDTADWQVRDERPVDASPDGQFVVFESSADLTHTGTGGTQQVFEYDAGVKKLVLASAPQGGTGGAFSASIVFPKYTDHFDPSLQPSSVSNDGSVVAFESEAALTPHALQGYGNVYEYRGGVLGLISDGQDRSHRDGGASSVSLVGVDGSGQDIFFMTSDQLVPQDGDTQEDVYDARAEGGVLPVATAECRGEGCQGPLAPSLADITPVSFGQPAGEQVSEPPPPVKTKPKPSHKPKRTKHRTKTKARRGKKAQSSHRGASGAGSGSQRR